MRIFSQLNRLKKDIKGTPALEFALIAPLFFATLFATFELGRALYERNRMAGSLAVATRTIFQDSTVTNDAIIATVEAALSNLDSNDLTVTVSDTTISDQAFKEINVSYAFEFLINFGSHFGTLDLEATRFAPVIARSSTGSSGGTSGGSAGGSTDTGGGDTGDDGGEEEEAPTCRQRGNSRNCR